MDIETLRQVDLLFALFLGRLPESNFVRHDNLGRPLLELVRAMISSDEFRQSIIERFLLHEKLPHRGLSLRLLPDALALVAQAGLVPPQHGFAAVDWKSTLGRMLAELPCRAILEEVYGIEGHRLIRRLNQPSAPEESGTAPPDPAPPTIADIVSGIEIVANTICRGWVIDRAHPDATLFVKIALNGAFEKILPANEFRRDVQARFGGEGRAGFGFQVDQLPGARGLGGATIELTELVTGTVILPEHRVELSTVPALTVGAQLHYELTQIRDRVEQLRASLRDVNRRRQPVIGRLRGSLPSEAEAQLHEDLARVLKSLNRIERDLPKLSNKHGWALSRYGEVRSTVDLVSSPSDIDDPPTFTIVVVADDDTTYQTEAIVETALAQILRPREVFIVLSREETPSSLVAGVEIVRYGDDEGPSIAINRIAARAKGSYLLLFDSSTSLQPAALQWFAAAIDQTSGAVLYSDEEVVVHEATGQARFRPIFRPSFDYDLLLQRNYIGATICVRRETFNALGGLTGDPALDSRYDLLLRVFETMGTGGFVHVPQLLLSTEQRQAPDESNPDCTRTLLKTVQAHFDRIGSQARAVPHTDPVGRSVAGAAKILWGRGSKERISVVIPTRDRADLVFALLSSLRRHTADWDGIEIIVAVNGNPSVETRSAFAEIERSFRPAKVVFDQTPFNWATINNEIVNERSNGDLLCFLNDDMLCITNHWDSRLQSQLSRDDIGVIGGRLLYPNGMIQHAGIVFFGDGTTSHEASGDSPAEGLYLDRTLVVHNVGAVTGAFLACRRSLFDELSGFDNERYAITSSDADFCVRARIAKKRVVYDPFLTWIHFESISRGQDSQSQKKQWRAEAEHERWLTRFSDVQLIDLSLNPHFSGSSRPFETFRSIARSQLELWMEAQRAVTCAR
jgi:GT2 family glycosyltransferase